MPTWGIGMIGLALFVVLMAIGVRIFYASALVGLLGIAAFVGLRPAEGAAGYMLYTFLSKYDFSVIPLFILMGFFAYYAGISEDLFYSARKLVGHVHGGLPIATALGCAGFAACSGSSVASAALMSKLAIPEMLKDGVHPRLATGVVAAAGTLASLIPPSVLMVVYGIVADQSIGKLLMGGYVPGLLTVVLYSLMIYTRCRINPKLAPPLTPVPWKERFASLKFVWSMFIVVVLIMGGLYTGVFTASEAGGMGAIGTLVILIARGKASWSIMKASIMGTGETTFMSFGVMLGMFFMNVFLSLSGFTDTVTGAILESGLNRYIVYSVFILVYLFLGMFIGAIGMVMITVPFFLPVMMALGFDPIWFGIIVVKMAEIAMITPPVGMTVFVVHAVRKEIPTMEIFKGCMPFFYMEIVTTVILTIFPQIVTWLPDMMVK